MTVEVSVIVPVYNRGPYIARALTSILNQTFQDFEIFVIDGGSTDDGPQVVKGFRDPRIHLVQQAGTGVSAARNQGVQLATSGFIAFLDADDEWTPGHLATLVQLRRKYPGAGLCATAYRVNTPGHASGKPKIRGISPPPWEGLVPDYFSAAVFSEGTLPFVTSSAGVPKEIMRAVGGFQEGIQWGEDIDLWFRIVLKHPVAFSWEGEAIWHTDAGNRISGSVPRLDMEPLVDRARKELKRDQMKNISPFLEEYLAIKELNRSLWNIKAGHPERAREILRAIETKLFYFRWIRLTFFAYLPAGLFRFAWRIRRSINRFVFRRDYTLDPWQKQA